jgi:hypothetical protein
MAFFWNSMWVDERGKERADFYEKIVNLFSVAN